MSQNRLGIRPHLHISVIINACCAIIYMKLSCPQTHCCVGVCLAVIHPILITLTLLLVIYRMLVC